MTRICHRILFTLVATFSVAPVAARICMTNNPTLMATKAQITNLQNQLTELKAQVNVSTSSVWLAAWVNASGTLSNSAISYTDDQSGTWSVTANQPGTGTHTAGGASLCSDTDGGLQNNSGNPSQSEGYFCWCKMTSPRFGNWAFLHNHYILDDCFGYCANACASAVRTNTSFRTVILLPL